MGAALEIRTDLASPARLRRQARRERSPRTATRTLAIANAVEGMSRAEAARLAGMERQALRDSVMCYNAEGPQGLRDRPKPGRPPALVRLDRGPVQQAAAPRQPVAHRPSPRPVAAKDAAAAPARRRARQSGFRKKGLAAAVSAAATANPDKRMELWFMDETRVGQKGRTGFRRLGARRAPARAVRQALRVGLFVRRRPTRDGFALVLPEVSTGAMQVFLDRFAATSASDAHAVLVPDRADWHGSRRLMVPSKVTLVPRPSYAPELNPVERVWLLLRERFLSHRPLESYDAIVAAYCDV